MMSPEELEKMINQKLTAITKMEDVPGHAEVYLKLMAELIEKCTKVGETYTFSFPYPLKGIKNASVAAGYILDDGSISMKIYSTGTKMVSFDDKYDVDAINKYLLPYNISVKLEKAAICVERSATKKKEVENVDVNALDEVSRTVENKQPVGFVPPTSAYEEISKSVKTVEEPAYDDISRTTKTSIPMGFVVNNEVDYNNYGRSR